MQIYTGGQVSAKVVLDTKEFDSAIEKIAERMNDFQSSLKSSNASDFSSKISDLENRLKSAESTINNLKNRIDDYKTKLNDLRNANKNGAESFKAVITQSTQYKNQLKELATALKDYRNNIANANQANAQFRSSIWGLALALKKFNAENNRFKTESQQSIRTMSLWAVENEKVTNSFEKQQKFIQYIHTGYNRLTNSMVRTTEVLKTFNFALLDGIDKESIFYRRTVQLASAMQRMNSQGTANWAGRGQFGYSQYVSQITRLNEAMTRQKQIESSIKAQKLDQYYAKVGSASAKYWNQIRQGTINLNTYKSQMNQINSILNQQTSRTQKLASAQHKLFQQYHTTNLNTYKSNMSQINAQLEKQQANFSKTETNARSAGRGITSFNNGVVQTAHSGRILSNTLYQIRGALLSLKMIFTAMGGMALWGFASSIAEGVKETLTAKNEMEAQLRQNNKVGEGGIAYFNRQLEETTKLFPKINKYSIGETVSSIGLEFNLNAKEMSDSLDIVSMVQSEYVRAGRKEAEAALAVKDILQGEFSRLSRETGVGKEELIAYGWNGKKDDVSSLMKALRKAAKDRHWDIFAAKATSLNDVMTILKSRFSETGADILNSATPLIVGAFNTLIGAVDKIEKAFNGLNSFWQNFTLFGGALSGILAIGTALPMVTKGMGLADIATIGWGKSILTAALNLNKAEVAQYGFRKALAAVITGEKASEIATVRSTKAILGRLLGVNQTIMKQEGLAGALIASRAALKGESEVMALTAASSMNLRQKLTYLVGNISLADAKTAGWGKTLKALVTSTKLLKIALAGLMAVGVIAWLSSIAAWCDKVKGYVDGFNDVAENGNQILQDANSTVSDYEQSLSKLTKGTDDYARAEANLAQAKANRDDIEKANELVKTYKEQNDETEKGIKLRHQSALKDSYVLAGKNYKDATELASGYQSKVRVGQYYINKSLEVYDDRLYKASQHMNEHVQQLKDAGVKGDALLRYIDEYNVESENAAELWKKFNQGDMASGAYAMLSELKLAWIDISNHPEVVKLSQNLAETWKGFQPTLKAIIDDLRWLGLRLVDLGNWFLSNDMGRAIVTWGAFGTVVGAVALKVGKWITRSKSTLDVLKNIGTKLKERITDWRNYGDEAEKANKKAGGGTTSTGGINGETVPDTKQWKKGEFWKTVGNDAKNIARSYFKAATHIAGAILLVSEAIALMTVPMGALALTGYTFEHLEPQIRKGIDGLKLIAPVMAVFLPPVIALMAIMEKYGKTIQWESMGDAFLKSAVGIAMGISLVTEAILLLNMPMIAMGTLGSIYGTIEHNVQQGITAMDTINQGLMALVPWIPVFVGGIALAAITFGSGGFGGIAIVAAAGGIAIGIGLVTEAIFLLNEPLIAISALGTVAVNLPNVEKGAETIKQTAEAMTALSTALSAMVIVDWALIQHYIDSLVLNAIGIDLTSLTEEGGFFTQLNTFIQDFNEKVKIDPIEPTKVENLKSAATGLSTVGEALKAVQTAMDNLPHEFKNSSNKSPNEKYQEAVGGSVTDVEGYFDQFKEPLRQLKTFIDDFNNSEEFAIEAPLTERIDAINQASSMIGTIKTAVDNVKVAMQGIGDAGWAANMAQGGIGSAISGWFGGLTGSGGGGAGGYSSSLGSSFEEMENVISDIVTFNNNVSSIVGSSEGGDGGTVTALADMVTAVDTAIQGLSDSLTNAVPQLKGNAEAIGTGIHTGLKDGIGDLSTPVIEKITTAVNSAKAYANTYGKGLGDKLTQGFKSGLKIAQETGSEILRALTYLDGKQQDFYDKGYKLGDSLSKGYQDGNQMHSPGLMARSTFREIGYIEEAFDNAIIDLPTKATELGSSLASGFSGNMALNLDGISVDDLTQFQSGLDSVSSMANSTDMQTSTAFTNMNTTVGTTMQGMTTSVNGAFTNINTNATSSYARLTNTTKNSLKNMQDQTTKNIGAIRQSWKGMQTALIQSAETIRNETSSKIQSLQSNMASFWRKVQNPALLLGAAGGHKMGTIRRNVSSPKVRVPSRGTRPRFAAGGLPKRTGAIPNIKVGNSNNKDFKMKEAIAEYLQCLLNGGICAAGGGWSFNWSKDIKNALLRWHTHFGEIYDDVLTVGKFENDDFPVRGIASIAKRYIFDTIRQTSYDLYWNSRYSPLEAWNRRAFNCVDGAALAIALASSFGFGGGSIQYGTWNGIGHGFAVIPGLGVIDATAIQNRGSFTAPGTVKGYPAAGGTVRRNPSPAKIGGNTFNGDINVNVTIEGKVEDAEETGRQIGEEATKTILDFLKRSDATGM